MSEVIATGPVSVIPLKETLARRLSASMDCIDAAGHSDEKAAAAVTVTTSDGQLAADEPAPENENPRSESAKKIIE